MRSKQASTRVFRWAAVAACWAATAAACAWLDGRVDLGSQALLLVAAAAVTAIWWSAWASMGACVVAVLVFNWSFVPPRGTLAVELPRHALLLATMFGVSGAVALLMARQRRYGERERLQRERAAQIHDLAEQLRADADPDAGLHALQQGLERLGIAGCALMVVADSAGIGGAATVRLLGEVDDDERAGLRACAAQSVPFGPGTGRYDHQPAWYLPLRGRSASAGAALLRLTGGQSASDDMRRHAQALCDQMGLALERAHALAAAAIAREQAQSQATRNTLLAAVAHDFRTPLATIMSAASSLREQADRLPEGQRQRLLETIVDEAGQLGRMTDNALQLARLAAPGLPLALDWQSCEEIAGSVLQRVRRRDGARRVRARVEPGLPLVRADAALIVQLLDNLIDNALKYSPRTTAIELRAYRTGDRVLLAVRDRGPGVEASERERLFGLFERGVASDPGPAATGGERPRGTGVGLAVCRAIARAHGGDIRCRGRGHGGASFECWLPVPADPPAGGLDAPRP